MRHGYENSTMRMVATAAGASSETLYRHFSSKEELFVEVVRERARLVHGDLPARLDDSRPMQDVLVELAVSLLTDVTSPAVIDLLRVVTTDAVQHPELGAILHAFSVGRMRNEVSAYLSRAASRGDISLDDPHLAADLFLGSLNGHPVLEHLLGAGRKLTRRDIVRRAQAAVSVLLASIAIPRD